MFAAIGHQGVGLADINGLPAGDELAVWIVHTLAANHYQQKNKGKTELIKWSLIGYHCYIFKFFST